MRGDLNLIATSADACLRLGGADRSVRFDGAADLIPLLRRISRGWVAQTASRSSDSFLTITKDEDGGYRLFGAGRDGSRSLDVVNALSDVIAAVARERAETDLRQLYLHSAGVEIGGRLILFPGVRRAGKSLLTAALAQVGQRVFGDDVVPLSVADDGTILGHGFGASQRLRRPLPVGPELESWTERRAVLSNAHYTYLSANFVAERGRTAPIGGIVFLDRAEDRRATPDLRDADPAFEMGALLHQNFARLAHSGDVLTLLGTLADSLPVMRLSYAAPEAAAVALTEAFCDPVGAPARCAALAGRELRPADPDGPSLPTIGRVIRDPAAEARRVGAALHVSDARGHALHQFDPLTEAVWRMLKSPRTAGELAGTISDAFPEVGQERITRDVSTLLARLSQAGLLKSAA